MISKVYFIIHRSRFIVERVFNMVHTSIRLYVNKVEHSSYRCYGVPDIYVATSSGSRMLWGENFAINNGRFGNAIGYINNCHLSATSGGCLIIGNNVGISQSAIIASGADVNIGDNTKIGGGVKIYTTDFHSQGFEYRRDWNEDRKHVKVAPVAIGKDCFIGAGSFILKGVHIGSRSIIGAGSVVTKDVPEDEIWAGNPAKFVKKII